jgi:hypothetical protein
MAIEWFIYLTKECVCFALSPREVEQQGGDKDLAHGGYTKWGQCTFNPSDQHNRYRLYTVTGVGGDVCSGPATERVHCIYCYKNIPKHRGV